MNRDPALRKALITRFSEVIQEATGASPQEMRFNTGVKAGEPDALCMLDTAEGPWTLLFSIRKTFYPRDVRDALDILDTARKRNKYPNDAVLVLLADQLSTGAREELRLRGVSFFDLSGTLYFKHRNWLINIEKSRPPKRAMPRRVDLFKGARESVVHAVLQTRGEWFSGMDIAASSETSGFSVSTVLKELEQLEWVQSQGQGRHRLRRLIQPGKLLDAWSNDWTQRRHQKSRWYLWCPNPERLFEALGAIAAERRLPCAFTGAIVANRLSPLLTHVDSVTLIVPSDAAAIAEEMNLKPAEKGSNVVLVERHGASLLFLEHLAIDGAWMASPYVQYLDLLDGRGRNAELAAQLRRDVLKI